MQGSIAQRCTWYDVSICMHFSANGHKLAREAEGYAVLSLELVKDVEATRNPQHVTCITCKLCNIQALQT